MPRQSYYYFKKEEKRQFQKKSKINKYLLNTDNLPFKKKGIVAILKIIPNLLVSQDNFRITMINNQIAKPVGIGIYSRILHYHNFS